MRTQEGTIDYKGYKTWYKIVGEQRDGQLPLLMLHGGPGAAHNYLLPFEYIAEQYGRQLVFYDQIGCGKSPIPPQDPDFYSIELWVDEFVAVREALGLDRCHVLGQSWGGMLALECLLRGKGEGVASAVLASSLSSTDLWLKEAYHLRSFLPIEMQEALNKADELDDYSFPEAEAAMNEFYARHILSKETDEVPQCFLDSVAGQGECYLYMQGKTDFVVTGKLKGWDITDQLGQIGVPTLVLTGTDDEATPLQAKIMHDAIPGSEWALVPGGTHLGHCYRPKEYGDIVEQFISKHDA